HDPSNSGEEDSAAKQVVDLRLGRVRISSLESHEPVAREPCVGVELSPPRVESMIPDHQQSSIVAQLLQDRADDAVHLAVHAKNRISILLHQRVVPSRMLRVQEAVTHMGHAVGGGKYSHQQGWLVVCELLNYGRFQRIHVPEEILQEHLLVDLLLIQSPGLMDPAEGFIQADTPRWP